MTNNGDAMNPLEAMQIFVRVAEMASFTQAATTLGLPKASVSTAVQRLETQLSVQLLRRTTRKVLVTADGERYYQRCKVLLAEFESLNDLFRQQPSHVSGVVRVDMTASLARHLIPHLPEFLRTYSQLQIELSCTDRFVDVVKGGFDCVVRIGKLTNSNLIAKPLGQYNIVNCASADYVERFGLPASLQDLAQHQLIHYSTHLGAKPLGWEYQMDGREYTLAMPGIITVNNPDAYLAACQAGLGIVQIPLVAVKEQLALGELVEILPEFACAPMPVNLIYSNRNNIPQRVQVFMTWASELIKKYLE